MQRCSYLGNSKNIKIDSYLSSVNEKNNNGKSAGILPHFIGLTHFEK
jgi:hypothetical protein